MLIETIDLPASTTENLSQRFYIYRGDRECAVAPGNKRHKLKHHIQAAVEAGYRYIATFGGPHSNHIAAFVARCCQLGITPIVVVRGEVHAQLTPTLRQAVDQGAILFPSTRADYRLGLSSQVKRLVNSQYDAYWVPEGGGGLLGFKGCYKWAQSILSESMDLDCVCVASGTGTTAAGFAAALDTDTALCVFSALKGVEHLAEDIVQLCEDYDHHVVCDIAGFDEAIHGGFGKMSSELVGFLTQMHDLNPSLQLDPVYTSKMLYRVNSNLVKGQWPFANTLFIHTGGLQGWQGVKPSNNPYLP